MKAVVVALSLATAVFAQSSSSSSSAPVPSGMPTGTSAACSNYLTSLNQNVAVNKCLTALINATDSFNPTSSGISTANPATVDSALGTICAANFVSCPASTIRQELTNFYAACGIELLGSSGNGSDGNKQVIALYDFLYLITPMKAAICSKGDDGKYCVKGNTASTPGSSSAAAQNSGTESSSGAASSGSAPASSGSASVTPSASGSSSSSASSSAPTTSASHAAKRHVSPLGAHELLKRAPAHANLLRRQASNTTQETLTDDAPHADAYRQSGLPYLFITPNSTDICNTCTRKVIAAYIDFETITPYAIGIPNSPLLSGQVALWEKIKTCGPEFINNVLNGTAAEQSTGGALASRTMSLGSVVLAVAGAAAVLMV